MARLNNVLLKDKEIVNERIELTDKSSLYFLSDNLLLRNCTLVLKVPSKQLSTKGVHLIDCTLEVKQELGNYAGWLKASLQSCRFKGKMPGCEFGRWPDYAPGWEHGSITDCDFSESHLHGCRFHGCDPLTLRLPRWPYFTLLDPRHRYRDWLSLPWPGNLGSSIIESISTYPRSSVAVTWSATLLAKEKSTTEEAFRDVISQCEGILY